MRINNSGDRIAGPAVVIRGVVLPRKGPLQPGYRKRSRWVRYGPTRDARRASLPMWNIGQDPAMYRRSPAPSTEHPDVG